MITFSGSPPNHKNSKEDTKEGKRVILEGLEEVREHLGGELTITLIQGIGEGIEVHAMDRESILHSVDDLQSLHISIQNS